MKKIDQGSMTLDLFFFQLDYDEKCFHFARYEHHVESFLAISNTWFTGSEIQLWGINKPNCQMQAVYVQLNKWALPLGGHGGVEGCDIRLGTSRTGEPHLPGK